MRTRLLRAISLLWSAAILFSCGKDTGPISTEPDPENKPSTITAGFEQSPDTRSRYEFSDSEATVLWTRGDSFKLVRMNESSYSSATYTTQDDGVTKATFTSSKTLSGSEFTCGYPADIYRVGRKGSMGCYLITPVPSTQKAVAGGVEEGLNRAAAFTTSPDADLHFHNMLAGVRFRLEGGIVPDISSVTFSTSSTIAGDASVYFEDGEPVIDFSKGWSNPTVPRSNSITLEGPFEEGKDYCILMVPGLLDSGFNMSFRSGEGRELNKVSVKALRLNRSRITDFGTIRLGDSWEPEPDLEPIHYIRQTKGSKPQAICVAAEGFTATEQEKFVALAKAGMDFLFEVEPFKSYREYFNVYLFPVVSAESGASVTDGSGNVTQSRNTYFKTSWGENSYTDMKADANTIRSFVQANVPEVISGTVKYTDVPTLILINDTRYGGICHIYANGWNYCMVTHANGGGKSSWSFPKYQAVSPVDDSMGYRETTDEERDEMGRNRGDWRNSLLHEFGGHCYSRLTDEYWTSSTPKYTAPGAVAGHTYTVPYGLNVSGYYDSVPWQEDLLDNLESLAARNPDYARVGKWHGGASSIYFRWRAEPISCMIDNRAYFNAWQRMLIVRRILNKTGEEFNMEEFLEKDVTTDPVRPIMSDEDYAKTYNKGIPVPELPMLPPPVIVESE